MCLDVTFTHLVDELRFVAAALIFISRTSILHDVTRREVFTQHFWSIKRGD